MQDMMKKMKGRRLMMMINTMGGMNSLGGMPQDALAALYAL